MILHDGDNSQLKNQIQKLWAYAFSDPESFISFYFDGFWQGRNAVTITDGDRLAAALELVPYSLSVREKTTPASYIVGVSVDAEYRGRGLSAALMKGALQKQMERGEVFSLLTPFSYSFYERMGYAQCYSEIRLSALADRFPKRKYSGRFRQATAEDCNALSQIYEAFCRDKNGHVVRTEKDWRFICDELAFSGGFVYLYCDEKEMPSAYVTYIKNHKQFRVLEAAYQDSEDLSALLSFILSHASTHPCFDMILPIDSPIPSLLVKPVVSEIHPTVMARLLNISKGLSHGLCGLKLFVTDGFLPENTGVYEEKDGFVQKTDWETWDISLDIGSLSQLVLGFHSARELALLGKLTGTDEAVSRLDRLYPKQQNYINHILRDDM